MNGAFSRFVAYPVGVTVAVGLASALFVYSIESHEVRTAQQMMQDASRLQIEVSDLNDVLTFARKYNGDAAGSEHGKPCLESDCLVTAAPDKDDFWERHPKLHDAGTRISKRRWFFLVLMWVEHGRLVAIQQWFGYSTPQANSFVIATSNRPSQGLCRTPSYRLHRMFAVYPGPKHFNVWVNPAATHEKEMLQLNVGCALSMSGCMGVANIVPAAWNEYEADQQLLNASNGNRNESIGDADCR